MSDLIRDAPIGQLIRWLTGGRILKYEEELDTFKCPPSYAEEPKAFSGESTPAEPAPAPLEKESEPLQELSKADTEPDPDSPVSNGERNFEARTLSKVMTRPSMNQVRSRVDLENAYSNATRQETIKQQASRPIVPERTADGVILVDWYTTDDQANPQNWSGKKKGWVVLQIYMYTLAVYIGSAIYTPSEPYVIEIFGVSPTAASLGLALYVLGYGTGPLLFSPLSEIPIIGRNPPYMATFGIFVILCVPTALVNNFAGLLVLRFLQGFFGSPCLATGGASIGDLYSLIKLPYFLTGWAAFATAGPALGPLISGFSVPAENWRWSLWEMLWISGPVFISLFLFLPETSSDNILLRRAARLRKLTGNPKLKAQSEIDQAKLTLNEIVVGNLWRPLQINALDPAVLFTSVYVALVYGIFYSFFEVFPIVYGTGNPGTSTHGYGFNLGEEGLIFLCISVAVIIAIPSYFVYLRFVFEPEITKHGLGAPEKRLVPAIFASLLVPPGLFLFAWTANSAPKIHWIVPTIGVTIYTIGVFLLIQCIFIYIPLTVSCSPRLNCSSPKVCTLTLIVLTVSTIRRFPLRR